MSAEKHARRWSRIITATFLATLGLSTVAGPASAGTPVEPEIADIGGDANALNGHGMVRLPDEGVSTDPVSVDKADIRAIWFETAYESSKVRDDSGRVLAVERVPVALRVHIKTEGPITQDEPISLTYRVPMKAGECPLSFMLNLVAAEATPLHRVGAELTIENAQLCLPGAPVKTQGISYAINGSTVTLNYPFAASEGILADDVVLSPSDRAHVKRTAYVTVGIAAGTIVFQGAMLDIAPLGRGFVIGSDVPANIDCAGTPGHAECA